MIIVSDASPLINCEKLNDGVDLLKKIYSNIIIPNAVFNEIMKKGELFFTPHYNDGFIEVHSVSQKNIPEYEKLLGDGESEAIALALQLKSAIMIEETRGRAEAMRLGLVVTGLAGQISYAYQKNIVTINEVYVKLDLLLSAGGISKTVRQTVLEKCK